MKKAIVLAGTIPHIEVIKNLKSRGYETILVDFNPNCPARPYADKYINESTLNKEAVLKIAEEEQADLVISIVGDHINAVCAYVAEKLGLPHPYSYENALKATRKSLMKPLFKQNNIPTAEYYVIDKNERREIKLPFPLVVKPSDANSSRGVFKVDNEEEFNSKIEIALSLSREGKAIVERFIDGVEIEVDCMAISGKAYICMTTDLPLMELKGYELQTAGTMKPGETCEQHIVELQCIAQKILEAYQLESGAFFYQAKVNEEGVFVIEAAARMAGGSTYDSSRLCCDVDYVDLAIDGFLGNKIEKIPKRNGRIFVGYFLNMKPGIFGQVIGLEEAKEKGLIVNSWVFVSPGTTITESHVSANRICTIMAEGISYTEGYEKIYKALELIKVLDVYGNDLSCWKDRD